VTERTKSSESVFTASLIQGAVHAKVRWLTHEGGFVDTPVLSLEPQGFHTFKATILVLPRDMRELAEMLTAAADQYEEAASKEKV
jgi:hypothetical protein